MNIEKQKAAQGELYNPNDADLIEERNKVKELCKQGNEGLVDYREILGSLGEGGGIVAPFWCDYGYNIHAGNNLNVNHNCVILDGAEVRFGDDVLIAPNCTFTTATHPLDPVLRQQGLETCHPIIVGNNVWFGANVTVLPGVTIGDNAVIGAGAVVNRDVGANMVVAGVPAKVIRVLD